MELNNELKLLLIKTGPHKNDAAIQDLFNRIKDNDYAWSSRLSNFYKENPDVGTIDSEGKWTEPSVEELKAKLIEKEFVSISPPAIWEMEGYESEAAWNVKAYARNRAAEYPSIVDQLDKIYHEGIDAWKVDIKAIKDKHPKG